MDSSNPQDTRPPVRRATALDYLIRAFIFLWLAGIAAVVAAYVHTPHSERAGDLTISCGSVDELAVGSMRLVRHEPEPFWVVRVSESEVLAVSAVCTRHRCILTQVTEGEGAYRCPCDGSVFARDGGVLQGPAEEPLRRFNAEIRAGQIVVRL